MANPGPDSRPLLAIGELAEQAGKRPSSIRYYEQRLRDVADRKLPQIAALIERTELVRAWLESAARCECPNLGECPLFDDPPLPPRHHRGRRPRR